MRRWEHAGEGSAKFWEAGTEGTAVTVRFGRAGTTGQTRVKEFGTPEAAESYLAKTVAEKERKGYVFVGGAAPASRSAASAPAPDRQVPAAADAPAAAADPTAGGASGAPVGGPPVRPDEDTFVLPEEWKRSLRQRRGGTLVTHGGPAAEAPARLARWRAQFTKEVDRALDFPDSDPALVAAARAHEAGRPDPVGAAVVAALLPADAKAAVVADAWAVEHGLPFAARAAVELLECHRTWQRHVGRSSTQAGVAPAPEDGDGWGRGDSYAALDRVRALLAVTDEATYAATVDALAAHRTTPRRRVAVTYLVPTVREWADACCADADTREHPQRYVRALLVSSLGTPAQLDAYAGHIDLGWRGWVSGHLAVLATAADSLGPAIAPFVAAELDHEYVGSDDVKALAGALTELPSDEAFQALLDRMGDKHVRAALATAVRRYPVRALRLLPAAARGDGAHAPMARRMLAAHVAAHRELALAVLPELPAAAAETVAPLTVAQDPAADAPASALPDLLVTPPWTARRTAAEPRVVTGLVPPAEQRLHWLPEERQAWATAESWVTGWQPYEPMDRLVDKFRRGVLHGWHTLGVLTHGPADQVRPLLADWDGMDYAYDGGTVFKPLVAAHELAALPPLLRMADRHPATLSGLLLPFLDVRVARLMADWHRRLKSAGRTARGWLLRHGTDAARLLVPDAVGAPGPARTAAETALWTIAAGHGPDSVRAAAKEYGEEAAEAVEALLSADPLVTALPARMPKQATWLDPRVLPRVHLKDGAGALPVPAVAHLLTMLSLSRPGAPYPGIERVRETCTPDSLAAFAWALFEEWRIVGMPPKEAWALHALGVFGDDDTVRALTPVIRAWPGEGAHHRAVDGLDVLAAIGTDTALLHLHGVAQRVKFKALRQRAQEKIAEVAADLGLTGEQLADRLVPDLGLDADGSTVLDYGTRTFTVGFDEQLRPFVRDETGRRLKDLPKPGARDETERATAERKRFLALKKEVRTLAADQVRRLEAAMVDGRSWTGAEFRQLFVDHPLVRHLARRLVWRAEHEGRTVSFRIAEDLTYADVEDDALTLDDEARVTLPHPLRMNDGEREAWAEVLADYEIVQPFPQLGRPVHAVTAEEAAGSRLTRFEGVTVPVGRLLALTKRGWERGDPQDNGVERWFSRRLGPERHLVIALDEGIAVGMIEQFPEQTLETIWLDTRPGDHWGSRTYPLRFGDLDPVVVSELLTDLVDLTEVTG